MIMYVTLSNTHDTGILELISGIHVDNHDTCTDVMG